MEEASVFSTFIWILSINSILIIHDSTDIRLETNSCTLFDE